MNFCTEGSKAQDLSMWASLKEQTIKTYDEAYQI